MFAELHGKVLSNNTFITKTAEIYSFTCTIVREKIMVSFCIFVNKF